LRDTNPYPHLERENARLAQGLSQAAREAGLPHTVVAAGSMFTLFFHGEPVTNYSVATKCDTQRFARYFWGLIDRGIYLPCSRFEANFVSTAHTPENIDTTIAAAREVLKAIG